jgi:2-polyprenyl-3-methyl-5-hydroxy-6-metoxy-1,4-benzoquinol methylase
MTTEHFPSCPLCLSTRTADYCSGAGDVRRQIPFSFRFFLCRDCRLRFQVSSMVDPKKLFEVQDQAQVKWKTSRRELRCDPDVLRSFARIVSGRRLLEIGPGDGRFLESARREGWDCLGVDVSERLAEYARRRSGVDIMVGNLRQLNFPAGSFDVVNLDQVLSYVEDPMALLAEVEHVLKPGGICRIREYNPDSIAALLAGKKYWMYAPTHLLIWSYRSVRKAATATKMRIICIFPGTEASLISWLDTERSRRTSDVIRGAVQYLLRKIVLLGWGVAADRVYYLRKAAA